LIALLLFGDLAAMGIENSSVQNIVSGILAAFT
jgi:hypothetical protein